MESTRSSVLAARLMLTLELELELELVLVLDEMPTRALSMSR